MGAVTGCSAKTIKYLVFFFNFLVFVAGVAIVAGSVAAYVLDPVQKFFMDDAKIKEAIDGDAEKLRCILVVGMVLGGILLILGFLGCCGAMMENQCMLGTFVTIMIILLIIQVVIAILVMVNKDKLKDTIGKALKKAADDKADCTKFWKNLQDSVECCGQTGTPIAYCLVDAKCPTEAVGKGCVDGVNDKVKNLSKTAGLVMLIFLALEIGAVIFGIWLCCAIKNKSSYE